MARELLLSLADAIDAGATSADVAREVVSRDPLWLLVPNFHDLGVRLLERLDRPAAVLWKVEYLGEEFCPFLSDSDLSPRQYAAQIKALASPLVAYSFNAWNRRNALRLVPELASVPFGTHPVALKPTPQGGVPAVRALLGVPQDATLVAVAGLLHEAKGIDELARLAFRVAAPDLQFAFSVIADEPADTLKRRWAAGAPERAPFVHVRVGDYREWAYMAGLYRAADALLVNSRSDSWGRVITEAAAHRVAVIVRRDADCGTNHVLSGLTLVDGFEQLQRPTLLQLIETAHGQADQLARQAERDHAAERVLTGVLATLRKHTPADARADFERLVAHDSLGDLRDAIIH